MELALELGVGSYESLARSMTEREFERWASYAAKRRLPTERIILHLAQIACWIARTSGGNKDAKITDFVIELEQTVDIPDEGDPAAAAEFFAFRPRNRKEPS